MKTYLKIKAILLVVITFLVIPERILGQNNKPKKVTYVEIEATVKNDDGKAIDKVLVVANEGANSLKTKSDGSFKIKVKEKSVILLEALGYESKVVASENIDKTIILNKALLFDGQVDQIELSNAIHYTKRNMSGAVSSIDAEKLKSYPDMLLSNTLQGKALGLIVQSVAGGLGNNPSKLSIRGNSTIGNQNPLIIIDGFERPIDYLIEEEIGSIEVLKDASTKIIYGARAANGVIVITTKRGSELKKDIKFSVDYGVGLPMRMPDYLDAYNYTKLYDEARANDGLTPIYSKAYDGYKNSSGVNDLRYPNVDYYDYFLKDYTTYNKYTAEFSGGNQRTQYAVMAGYKGTTGLQKIGEAPKNDIFNIRGNLSIEINPVVSAYAGIMFQMKTLKRSSLDHAQTFEALSSHRPNEYPIFISSDYLPASGSGIPALGGSQRIPQNLYASLQYGGKTSEQGINGNMDFGLKFKLDKILSGLTAHAKVSLDNYYMGNEVLKTSAATYSQRWRTDASGQDYVVFNKEQVENINDNLNLTDSYTRRTTGWAANFGYNKSIGEGKLNLLLGYDYMKMEQLGTSQNIQNANYLFHANYMHANTYLADLTLSYVGSNRFKENNRFFLSRSLALGWIVSEEAFMGKNIFDFLKLKASAGILGYDANTPYFLYTNRYNNANNLGFAEQNKTPIPSINIKQVGNPNLKWEKSQEINVGIEGLAFDKRLGFEINYYNELRKDIIMKLTSYYSAIYGGCIPYQNAGKLANQGIELGLKWNDSYRDLEYQIGANVIWSKNKVEYDNTLKESYDYLNKIGKPSDIILGYSSVGLFGRDINLNGHPDQLFGKYGNGDIAYADLNDDDIIDENDRKVIGNTFPRTVLALDVNLNYKNWGLYLLGTSQLGMDKMLNNSYYWNYGENKYSAIASERYHAVNNPQGKYPQLTTGSGENNYRDSDFWIQDGGFVRLKNVEISYTFNKIPLANKLKIYTRGTNLLTISKIKDLDPEALNSGITNYPTLMTIVGGFSLTF